MGIVFSTIAENIKSFLQREEELTAKPKVVPDAASEIYKPKIVDKQLPTAIPKLPFSPDDLRQALKVEPAPTLQPKPAIVQPVERDISHDIVAFERELQQATVKPQPTIQPIQPSLSQSTALPSAVSATEAPFFNEFEQFLAREDLESDGILEKDILFRMKEFHKHRSEGKEYYLYSKDVQTAVNRKLGELKTLERDWFDQREQADRLEKSLAILEHEIELRTTELKNLLKQAKAKSRLEQAVPQGSEFVLVDGRKLGSLLDLKAALKSMPDTVFSHHVTSIKNDFAAWVRGALNDNALADEMGTIRDKTQLEMFLAKL